jgi:hypothetical protein
LPERVYRPKREAQSYSSRDCRRAAAYGRERFKAGTVGRRKRRLKASDKLPGTLVAGSVRNGNFSSSETGGYRPTNWIEELNQAVANEVDQAHWNREKRKWPVDVMGGARHSARRPTFTVHPELRQTIIETERLPRNDEPTSHALLSGIKLECYEDGYPKLPECLDRRPRLPILKAAYAGCLVQPREWRQRKRASATGWPIAQTLYSSTSMSISTANAATAG